MGFSSGTICEKCDFPHLKKEIQRCKASATEREKSTHQVTLGVTLNYVIPYEDNQQPKGNNIVVSLNNEISYIDNRSYNRHEEENEHSCQCYCGRVFNSYRGLNAHRRTCYVQNQSPRGIPGKRRSENMQQIYRKTPMPKDDFNKVAKQPYCWHGYSPVNLLHIFRTSFLKNTSG